MKRIIGWSLAVAILASIPLTAVAGSVDKIRQRGALLAGIDVSSPPFTFLDPAKGHVTGVNVDIAREIAKRLDVELRLIPVTPSNRIPRLNNGEIDFIASPMTKNSDRALLVDFSRTYFVSSQLLLAKKGEIRSIKDLSSRRVGVVKGTSSERNIRALLPSGSIRTFANLGDGATALRKGEIDALTGDGIRLFGVLYRLPDGQFEIDESLRLATESYGMAVRKGDTALLDVVNTTLDDLDRNGKEKEICDRWFQRRADVPCGESAPPSTTAANAVITRNTETSGRYLALSLGGVFAEGAEVSIYDSLGNSVGKGTIHRIYGDEIYVDTKARTLGAGTGFILSLNQTEKQVAEFLRTRGSDISGIRDEAKREAEEQRRMIASEDAREKERRERYQEDITREKMRLDYQYSDRYYYYYYQPWP